MPLQAENLQHDEIAPPRLCKQLDACRCRYYPWTIESEQDFAFTQLLVASWFSSATLLRTGLSKRERSVEHETGDLAPAAFEHFVLMIYRFAESTVSFVAPVAPILWR